MIINNTIKRSRRTRGRYAWYSRVPFVVFAALGAVAIIGMKMLGSGQIWVTLAACALIVIYACVVWAVPILTVREDQLGDNSYYLGFLYTLISLCWALYEFGDDGGVKAIVSNFGIALGSTIVGIVIRVFLNQARRDAVEIEREARLELSRAAGRLREEIEDAALALQSFCSATQQMAAEQMRAAAQAATKALEEGVTRIGGASESAMARIEEAGKRLEPALQAADAVAARVSDRLQQDDENLKAFAERSREMRRELETAVEAAREVGKGFSAAAGVATEISAAGQRAGSVMQSLAKASEAALEQQTRIAGALEGGSERVLAALKTYNDGIEAELDRSRRNIGRASETLVELADEIRRELA